MDQVFSPDTKSRAVVKIDVLVPYDNRRIGVERWTIQRDGGKTVAYIVKMIPDGQGGTNFNVGADDGKGMRDVPILPPPAK